MISCRSGVRTLSAISGLLAALGFVSILRAQTAANSSPELSGSSTFATIQARGRILVGNEFAFRTFNFRNPATGEHEGFMVDISKALAKRLLGDEGKVEYRWASGTTGGGNVMFVARGEVDVIIDAVAENPAFLKIASFSDEIFRSGSALLAKKGGPIRSMADIKAGTRVISDAGHSELKFVRAKHPEATYILMEDRTDEFEALRAGEGDVLAGHLTHLYNDMAMDPGYVIVERYFSDKPFGIVSPKNDPAFAAYLNRFVRELKSSGEYDRLFNKWFSRFGAVPPDKAKKESPAVSATLESIRKRGRLVVGSASNLRTFNFLNPSTGKREGFMADIARAFAQQALGDPDRVEWRLVDGEKSLDPVNRGEVDLILDKVGMGRTLERTKEVRFSEEIFRSGPGLLAKKGGAVRSLDDLSNATTILYVRGHEHDLTHLKLQGAPSATYVAFDSEGDAFAALRAGKGDVLTDTVPYLYDLASQDPDYTLLSRYSQQRYGIVSRKDDAAFGEYVDDFVKELKSSGELERLYQKWFVPYGGDQVR